MCNCRHNPFVWDASFPHAYAQTSISFLKRCPGFHCAKNGDLKAAESVIGICVKQESVARVRSEYSDAVLVPVMSENRLPEALASCIGLDVNDAVCRADGQKRTQLTAMERLLDNPDYLGKIAKGKRYVIVDDVITQGGTVSSVRRHILRQGGSVAAVVALAHSAGSRVLAPTSRDILETRHRFDQSLLTELLTEHNIAGDIRELTRSEMRYLLRFRDITSLAVRVRKTGSRHLSAS